VGMQMKVVESMTLQETPRPSKSHRPKHRPLDWFVMIMFFMISLAARFFPSEVEWLAQIGMLGMLIAASKRDT